MTQITDTTAWHDLADHAREMEGVHLPGLFAADPDRFLRCSVTVEDILFDYSKHRVTERTMGLLLALVEAAGVADRIRSMFAGAHLNVTEDRPVLHVALRRPADEPLLVDGHDVMPEVEAVRRQMRGFTEAVRSGAWRGHGGAAITDVVNIGIGGSDLGPRMVAAALAPCADGPRAHFVSNVDAWDLLATLRSLDPSTTLFIVTSKTFTTTETMTNAHSARKWLLEALRDEAAVARHFVAVSTNTGGVRAFGIDPAQMFRFWDWVGGRTSLWSAVGLSVAVAIGMDRFDELLAGAHAVDEHFRTAPPSENVPMLMGALGIWYDNFLGAETWAVLPYDQRLAHLPAYLQQLDMESNGKRVTLTGDPVAATTGPILWGSVGTNGQHAFFQLLHQGTKLVPCDFLLAAEPAEELGRHHTLLAANCIAQTEALMRGRTLEEALAALPPGLTSGERELLAAAKTFPGNRPSSTLLFSRLTPRVLGSLLALYEHKVFVQGAVWGINSFDQMGVELGKELARAIAPELEGEPTGDHDGSTNGLIAAYRAARSTAKEGRPAGAAGSGRKDGP